AAAIYGSSFRARVRVAPDRRSLRLDVSQRSIHLREVAKHEFTDPKTFKEGIIERPDLVEAAWSGAVDVEDEGLVLLPLYGLPSARSGRTRPAEPPTRRQPAVHSPSRSRQA